MSNQTWYDDDHLLAALKEALREAEEVPARFLELGRAAFAWHNIDAELADLTYDSAAPAAQAEPVAAMRAQDASLRALTFATAELSIEIEITADAVLGQVLPPQPGSASAYVAAAAAASVRVDEMGFFAIRPVPAAAFRLRCVTTSGLDIMTGLITP